MVSEIPLDWSVETDGEYSGTLRPEETGEYEIELLAARGESSLGTDRAYVHTAPSDDEYFDAAMRASVLGRIAEETGGRFYRPAEVGTLAEDITVAGGGVTLVEEHDLWDMPFLFLLILTLMGAEWGYRRFRGLI